MWCSAPKNTFEKFNSNVSFQKSWPPSHKITHRPCCVFWFGSELSLLHQCWQSVCQAAAHHSDPMRNLVCDSDILSCLYSVVDLLMMVAEPEQAVCLFFSVFQQFSVKLFCLCLRAITCTPVWLAVVSKNLSANTAGSAEILLDCVTI